MTGNFYKISWSLGDFYPEELELPLFVFETDKIFKSKEEVFNNKNVFVFEKNAYSNKTLISNILENKFDAVVSNIRRCSE
tara:strand:- start:235 stop:474 length:240 start_codon:yes stop_codon:yes gene_type:complete